MPILTVTVLGLLLAGLFGGSVVIETIFNWPGIGLYAYQSIENFDFPSVMGVTLLLTICVVLVNLAADILYAACFIRVSRLTFGWFFGDKSKLYIIQRRNTLHCIAVGMAFLRVLIAVVVVVLIVVAGIAYVEVSKPSSSTTASTSSTTRLRFVHFKYEFELTPDVSGRR